MSPLRTTYGRSALNRAWKPGSAWTIEDAIALPDRRSSHSAIRSRTRISEPLITCPSVTAFYDQAKARRLVGVTRAKQRGLGRLLKRDATRVRLRGADDERVGLVDGAACLRRHLEGLPLDAVVLDFWHLGEHVNDASRRTFGEGSAEGRRWSDEVLHAARHAGYEPFFAKLVDWRAGLRGNKRKVADRLLNYVAERQAMMPYDRCEARGWDVGTGPMESMCGVTTDRIKGRGRRWDVDNAEAVMALDQSNLWDRYWAKALSGLN